MTTAASATPSLTALGPALRPTLTTRSAATFTTRTAVTSAARTVLAGFVGSRSASVRMTPELLTATEPAASPRSDLGLI